ncbi:hypothetical protein LZZ90_04295 [Flavobacterium sp. SM15]|uniref:hypothetical protein n=1 Tax=Flavobacterium sp. SM15 TaxID=2908005 RepID=UPI001EDA2FCC|nr:hypothetical protein [Flavobacterium sp. SM15]MCG2610722.1 hypothetical protein [Flavobacterium sp. SM15]
MEPNKMEEVFRKALNEREIQPSEKAWDRLDAMLSVAENNKPKRNFRWLYIAAGLAIFFTVGLFLFQQEQPVKHLEPNTQTVVGTDVVEKSATSANQVNTVVASEENHQEALSEKSNSVSGTVVARKSVITQQQIPNEESAITEEPKQQVQQFVEKNVQVLVDLGNETQLKNTPNKKLKVNANSLLSSVEGELNQEFRETTLSKIKKNFKTVKTAVVNRNYE